ncbi:hypothetical protein BMH32_04615 [Leucobacter sp. OLJS4]|uniref:hypothetical protein n=1 Tax=unclassified Leucobacter TaxID=2621730 RepID=UPI000C1A799D|nr:MULTISPECIES: hypothetical protein [unclassified Leucobacter]PIJ55279.1 hypothetical protein BMH30_01270 [Leucobacter sp. OLES1]PII81575.1 hypothetical protein BMH25_13700 [Leucobacter sp. OLCALW19]PII86247.1 hypothetical protein BMH26_14125 [Leucobacter sp. OLTLW20]PII90142.1 hypothetical protein BMH27_12290 [Leucobacter sp. OLAS13]PII97175.1 hypothetical protein BMH29_12975 [Leucobacter sp. OLDS2]
MSFEHVAIAMNHSRATGAAKLVLAGIASHANDEGEAFPGLLTLARYAGFDGWDAVAAEDTSEARAAARTARESAARSARRAIRKLEELGEIRTETNAGGTRNRPDHMRPNLYTVTLACPPDCDHSAQHRRRDAGKAILEGIKPVDNSGGDPRTVEPGEGSGARTPRAAESPEPSTNHQTPQGHVPETPGVDASAHETPSEEFELLPPDADTEPAGDESHWNDQVKRPNLSAGDGKPQRPAPAPRFPKFKPEARQRPAVVSPEQQRINAEAERYPCPAGFGPPTARTAWHWCPITSSTCVRCDSPAEAILRAEGVEL